QGKDLDERCQCWIKYVHWDIAEKIAWSASVRDYKLMIWYTSKQSLNEDDLAYVSTTVLHDPDEVTLHQLMDDPSKYGFSNRSEAQELVDELNKRDEGKTITW